MLKGKFTTNGFETIKWTGWVVPYNNMGYMIGLFKEKPKKDPEFGWSFEKEIRGAYSDQILKMCGIDISEMIESCGAKEFFYGKESDGCGQHNPIKVEIILPSPIAEMLCLI